MATLRERGARMANRQAAKAAAVTGTYTRKGGAGSLTLTDFVAGNSDYKSQPAPGEVPARHDFSTRTLIGPASSLSIDDTVFEPAVGDLWEEEIGGETMTFAVSDSAEGRAFTHTDSTKLRIRIRLTRVP